jgi:hypothetical protein
LVCQAIWSLVEESTDLSQADLDSRIEDLEAADRNLLEELERDRTSCPRCDAAIPANMDKCQFCGHEL